MANTPFKLKGWSGYQNSPLRDDDLKNVDISGASIEMLEKMKNETDPKKNPNDYLKIANTLTAKKETKDITFLGGPPPPIPKFDYSE